MQCGGIIGQSSMNWKCKNCGYELRGEVVFPVHCVCSHVDHAVPTHLRPRWVRLVRILRKPEDKGVGDTVQRIAATFGGERFKAWAERIGIPCGCTQRQKEWNRVWPY